MLERRFMAIYPFLSTPEAMGGSSRAEAQSMDMDAHEHRHATLAMDGCAARQARVPVPLPALDTSSGIAGGDWDDLFNAVKYRLVHIVSERGFGPARLSEAGIAQVRDRVFECVSALDLLKLSVTADRLRHEGLEMAVFEAQA
jgi:hypothetical protein